MTRVVADLGNSRLKWGRVDPDDRIRSTQALPVGEPVTWDLAWDRWGLAIDPSEWAISTVNPPVAETLRDFLQRRGVRRMRWYGSAADIPIAHTLDHPERTGADRALAVSAAMRLRRGAGPGHVILCGSAVVVERISAAGVWEGGAIAPGLGLSSRALHLLTAQLPAVTIREAPPAWGASTEPAVAAGLFWGTVGAAREILARQDANSAPRPWRIWTGGEAPLLAPWVEEGEPVVIPDLVLIGLADLAFPPPGRGLDP